MQLQSDVPVGTLCSGGIDSSLVTLSAQESHDAPLHTFSVSFAGTDCDESDHASAVASRAGTIHHVLSANSETFAEALPRMTFQNDEPLKYENSVFVNQISHLARDLGVIVLLTGEGADEIFGGYPHLIRAARIARFRPFPAPLGRRPIPWGRLHLPAGIVQRLHSLLATEEELVIFSSAFNSSHQVTLLLGGRPVQLGYRENAVEESRGWSLADRVRAYDLATYLPPILMRQDKMSMAASVESRVPMLGNDLADFALQQPVRAFVSNREGKLPLRRLASKKLPGSVVERTKIGFRTPTAQWMRTSPGLMAMLDSITGRNARITGHLDAALAARWLDEHRRAAADHSSILWTLLALELWLRGLND
jgi:asparagine synthase (glutamine-hydrolysing)